MRKKNKISYYLPLIKSQPSQTLTYVLANPGRNRNIVIFRTKQPQLTWYCTKPRVLLSNIFFFNYDGNINSIPPVLIKVLGNFIFQVNKFLAYIFHHFYNNAWCTIYVPVTPKKLSFSHRRKGGPKTPNKVQNYGTRFFRIFAPIDLTTPIGTITLLLSIGTLSSSIWSIN